MMLTPLLLVSIIVSCASAPLYDTEEARVCSSENPEEAGGYFEGDIILDDDEEALWRSGIRDPAKRWPHRTVVYAVSDNFDATERSKIKAGIQEIASKTCIKFKQVSVHDDVEDYVLVDNQNNGCSSKLGFKGGVQGLNLGPRCFLNTTGRISHEFIHALGFYHEHSRTDRDDYIKIIWENIEEGKEFNFEKLPASEVDTFGVSYNYGSIMHYSNKAFNGQTGLDTIVTLQQGVQIGQRDGLSRKDASKINRMYGCRRY